ncbi:hypothetical protein [Stenotrophomonas geniculata]|uniref:hypothetical protein n=1 Tax=Stenotrophomonas TaxID=40323 RepID=UPI002E77DAD3|nr:hypothetical protein [Stenotrophomonas geniculata]
MIGKKQDAFIEKQSGEVKGPYQATFAGTTVILNDPTADVDSGDYVIRTLPGGKAERSYIESAPFYDVGIGGFGPHFQLKIGTPPTTQHRPHTINIQGSHSIQIGDHNTQNVVGAVQTLTHAIDASSGTEDEKAEAKSRLAKLLEHPILASVLGGLAGAAAG